MVGWELGSFLWVRKRRCFLGSPSTEGPFGTSPGELSAAPPQTAELDPARPGLEAAGTGPAPAVASARAEDRPWSTAGVQLLGALGPPGPRVGTPP